jgi:hypothetical protein
MDEMRELDIRTKEKKSLDFLPENTNTTQFRFKFFCLGQCCGLRDNSLLGSESIRRKHRRN